MRRKRRSKGKHHRHTYMGEAKESDKYKGWLYKWTNYLKGYQKRWFVVQNGLLSYYRNQAEMAHTCRGTINLAHASIEPYDSLTFVISNGGTQTFHLKATTEVERKRWVTALVLAKAKAASLTNAADDSDDMDGEIGADNIKQEVDTFLSNMVRRIDDLNACQSLVSRQGDSLSKALSDLESSRDPADTATRIRAINEKATVFRVASSAMINSGSEFSSIASAQVRRWQKLLQNEREQRCRLEAMVEDLAKQHRNLESKVVAANSPRNSLVPGSTTANTSRRQTPRKTAVNDLAGRGKQRDLSDTNDDDDDDHFFDALEENDGGFTFPLPRIAVASPEPVNTPDECTSPEGVAEVYRPDDYDSDDSLSCTEFAEVITKRTSQKEDSEEVTLRKKARGRNHAGGSAGSAKIVNEDRHSYPRRGSPGAPGLPASPARQSAIVALKPRVRRKTVPLKPDYSINLWGIMKNCIGKDLTKIPMPVNFSEPISMLQRLTEDYQYSELLDAAVRSSDSIEQLAYVAAFMVSSYSTTTERTGKPFNPLLGETFEFDRMGDLGWRSIAEQVSHHPPCAALHVEGRGWSSWQEYSMASKFRGKYLQVDPVGSAHVKIPTSNGSSFNQYSWTKVTTTVHNIVVGKLWVDHHGETDIVNHTNGDKCHLVFKAYSYFSREPQRHVTGVITDGKGATRYVLNGCWDEYMEGARVVSSTRSSGGKAILETGAVKMLWRRRPAPTNASKMYNFTQFAVELNEPEEGVAPTDSRWRPDQRLMENGRWDEANTEKQRLEEQQRTRRKQKEADKEQLGDTDDDSSIQKPTWFSHTHNPVTGKTMHHYTGNYWNVKTKGDWSICPNIF